MQDLPHSSLKFAHVAILPALPSGFSEMTTRTLPFCRGVFLTLWLSIIICTLNVLLSLSCLSNLENVSSLYFDSEENVADIYSMICIQCHILD